MKVILIRDNVKLNNVPKPKGITVDVTREKATQLINDGDAMDPSGKVKKSSKKLGK